MNVPTNEIQGRADSMSAGASEIKPAWGVQATGCSFEHAFCGVLVGLILAVAIILSIVAVSVVSHR